MSPELMALIDKVARATRELWRDECDIRQDTVEWEELCPQELQGLRKTALVAIRVIAAELREPSRVMINGGLYGADINWQAASEDEALSDDEVISIWRGTFGASILGEALRNE